MQGNFYGTLYMSKAFLLICRHDPRSYIACVSSTVSFLFVPGKTIYKDSKEAEIMVSGPEKDKYRILVAGDARYSRLKPKGAANLVPKQMRDLPGKDLTILPGPNQVVGFRFRNQVIYSGRPHIEYLFW